MISLKYFSDYENIEVSGDNTRLIFQIKNAKYVNTLYVSILIFFISCILSMNKDTLLWVLSRVRSFVDQLQGKVSRPPSLLVRLDSALGIRASVSAVCD